MFLFGLLGTGFLRASPWCDLKFNFQQLLIVDQEWLLIESERLNERVTPVLLASLLVSSLYLPVVFKFLFVQVRFVLHLIAAKIIKFQLFN